MSNMPDVEELACGIMRLWQSWLVESCKCSIPVPESSSGQEVVEAMFEQVRASQPFSIVFYLAPINEKSELASWGCWHCPSGDVKHA
jgi:hypothetical protein